MSRRHWMFPAVLALGLAHATVAQAAANIKIVNLDAGTSVGLDDPTPIAPVGGNAGTTRGEQASIVFQFAADLWGSVLESDVDIINTATFKPLTCTAASGVLGSSGTYRIFRFNAPAPAGALADTWYHSALTDALGNADANTEHGYPADTPDITSQFNSQLGMTGCLEGSGWYFGLDGNTPANRISLLDVIMHEMAHGLGFSGFTSLTTGAMSGGWPDIYSTFVRDNILGKSWLNMTNAERVAAAKHDSYLVFTGSNVRDEAPLALGTAFDFSVTSPAAIAGTYDYNASVFGPALSATNFAGNVAVPVDPLACDTVDSGVSGKVALIDRGGCGFTVKVKNAQLAGATAVILANNVAGALLPGGEDDTITIPTIGISQADGNTFKANIASLAVAVADAGHLAGTDSQGNVQLYAPTVLAQGSSFSHFDTRLTPNAIMEYAVSADLQGMYTLDLTPALFKDLGWQVNRGNQFLLACDTGVPTSISGGPIVGANLYGRAKAFAANAADVAVYRTGIRAHAAALQAEGLLTSGQYSSVLLCLSDAATAAQFEEWGNGVGTGPVAVELTNKTNVTGVVGAAASEKLYSFEASAGSVLTIMTLGGTGNVSLYVSFDEEPTATAFDFKSSRPGNSETVRITAPQAGTYYIKLVGESAYSGVTLVARQ